MAATLLKKLRMDFTKGAKEGTTSFSVLYTIMQIITGLFFSCFTAPKDVHMFIFMWAPETEFAEAEASSPIEKSA